ncbi:MAG: SDR family oxidoreductase [Candidatus Kapaibacterium sp.]
MKLLIIGGTVFLGRHFVEQALAKGHEVTLFNRGLHNAHLFPEAEKIHGDRQGDLSVLAGRNWDAVVDFCGYVPREVRAMAELLAGSVDHYTFVSSISVFSDHSKSNDENGPLGTLEDETVEEVTGETYGPLKALCEQAAEAAMPGRVCTVRPGLIVGPHDPSDRFTYWPHRVAQGGEVLAPGDPAKRVQIMDGRDLAGWMLDMVERKDTGIYNATGPDIPLTMGDVLEECRAAAGNTATLTWVSEEFLIEEEVGGWMEMPLWLPDSEEYAGFNTVDCSKAIAHGLRFRPISDIVRATLAWDATLPPERELHAGMKREREEELLAKWSSVAQN